MAALEVIFTILLNALPIALLFIPLFFIWKKTFGKLYLRIILGLTVFYVIYWILPIIFQFGETPDELSVPVSEEGNIAYGIGYIFAHLGSLIAQFFSYPIVTLPFIFLVAPFISIILFWNRLRKEDGTIKSNLSQVSYELKESPFEQTKKALIRNNWSREKQILKLMIVLLPISLYLMQVILQISGLTAETLTSGSTALGWFLEILFVYLAIFILSIEILFSSQVALKGRFFGEQIREQTYKSLYTIGTPMSVFSIILFAILYVDSISIVIYFFAYFIMASVIFILFIDIFEPISILIFIKVIDWWKNRKSRKVKTKNFYYMLIFGALALVSYFILNLVLTSFVYAPLFGEPGSPEELAIYNAGAYATVDPILSLILQYDLLIIYGIIITEIIPALILTLFLAYGLKFLKSKGLGISIYLPVIIVLSIIIILGSGNIYWLTGKTSYTKVFGFDFYTLRSASLVANWNNFLYILAAPYLYTRYVFNIILWSLIIFYFRKKFKVKNIILDEQHIKKIIYSTVKDFPIFEDYAKNEDEYLISRREDIELEYIDKEREEIKSIMQKIGDNILLEEVKPDDENEMKRFYFTLRYLYNNGLVNIFKPETSYVFEPVEKQGLYIIYDDGRGVYNYAFKRDVEQDPGLVSGMFSAITSFVKEMTKSTEALKKIDHGDITILLEYGDRIFGALFIKGNQTTEVRTPLKEFVKKFESQYAEALKNWTGSLAMFKKELNDKLVEDMFKEE